MLNAELWKLRKDKIIYLLVAAKEQSLNYGSNVSVIPIHHGGEGTAQLLQKNKLKISSDHASESTATMLRQAQHSESNNIPTFQRNNVTT